MGMKQLKELAELLRYLIILSTTKAGSGHPSSSLSSVEIVTSLFFDNFFELNKTDPKNFLNDRFILSKGHASPLLYSLYVLLGYLDKNDLLTLRQFKSKLPGHPLPDEFLVDVATGSLGQGLSIGLGMAMGINLKIKNQNLKVKKTPKVWVLLGDSEIAEGQVWEAVQLASYYQVSNLLAIVDVNRLGQRGETMLGWDMKSYQKRFSAFGWATYLVDDGHNFLKLKKAFQEAIKETSKPKIIFAKTIKGKGVSFLENKENWHGKSLNENEFKKAVEELGGFDYLNKLELKYIGKKIRVNTSDFKRSFEKIKIDTNYTKRELISTRKAYGIGLEKLGRKIREIVVLDAEVSNSTGAEFFKKSFPDRFFEMFIAEQNMISCGVGLSKVGLTPFCSSFAAFLTRGFDQIRIAAYSNANLKIVGSHSGVAIGEDGVSQMGLEDIAMMRAIFDSVVLYPCDAVATEKLLVKALNYQGIVYLKTTRGETPVIYDNNQEFEIGGLTILKSSAFDKIALIAAGITVFEGLKAYEKLKSQGILIRLIDLYSIKPINKEKLVAAVKGVNLIITVEDHYYQGGLGEAVSSILTDIPIPIFHLAVKKMPVSGKTDELLNYEEIDSEAIIKKIKECLSLESNLIYKTEEEKNESLPQIIKRLEKFSKIK